MTQQDTAVHEVQIDNNPLLDAVIVKLRLKNDAALARALEVAPPVISKTRKGILKVTPGMILRIYDAVEDMTIEQIRSFLRPATPSAV